MTMQGPISRGNVLAGQWIPRALSVIPVLLKDKRPGI